MTQYKHTWPVGTSAQLTLNYPDFTWLEFSQCGLNLHATELFNTDSLQWVWSDIILSFWKRHQEIKLKSSEFCQGDVKRMKLLSEWASQDLPLSKSETTCECRWQENVNYLVTTWPVDGINCTNYHKIVFESSNDNDNCILNSWNIMGRSLWDNYQSIL